MVRESTLSRVTSIRFNERMLENLEIVRADALRNDGIQLSNTECMRKALELLRRNIERKETSGVN